MLTEENLIKPKIFIRYPHGGSGHFLALLLVACVRDVHMTESHRGHRDLYLYNRYHNWQQQWTDQQFKNYTNTVSVEGIDYIQQRYKFYPTPDPYYIVHTHANNPDSILSAFEQAKLINIIFTPDDIDQLAYNWIHKSYFLHREWHLMELGLERIKLKYNKLLHIPSGSLNNDTDPKLLTYIQKYSTDFGQEKYLNYVPSTNAPMFNIKFSDIASKKLINSVDDLFKFLDVPIESTRKMNVINLINSYADSQITTPWKLTINDYD